MPTSLVCGMLILGGYANAETAYASIECLVPGLEAWFSNHSITGGYRQGRVSFENVAHVKEDATVSVLNAELTLANKFKFTPGAHSASINTQASFCLKPDAPKELQWYFDQVYKTINLLSLLAGSPMPPSEITLLTDATRPTEGHLSVLTSRLNSAFCDLTREWEFFIPRSILGESYEQVIQSWFSLYPQVEAACGLALSVINKNDLWTHLEFLSLMQALEGLHRALNDETYMSAADYSEVYDALVKAIPTNVSQPHRQALLSRIKYGNEISLRKCLRALEDNLSSPVRKCILGEAARVPQTWIDTRNYYTHWDETLKSSILDIENMHYASVRLRALLRVLYLHFAGVSDDILDAALKNNSRASLALKNAAKSAAT